MNTFISWKGSIIPQEDFRISPNNRGLRYGDGLFETMKAKEGNIQLENLHFERLLSSLQLLQFEIPDLLTQEYLRTQVGLVLEKNNHSQMARVRLMAVRGEGGMYDIINQSPEILIQSWPIEQKPGAFNVAPVHIDIFTEALKVCDMYSGIKSNNYLCYRMGAVFAKRNTLDDALILNAHGRIADSTIANVFIISNGMIKTPPLTEGCVNGVFRKYLLQSFTHDGMLFREEAITINALLEADEVFLTNAITGIRMVDRCQASIYTTEFSSTLYARYQNR